MLVSIFFYTIAATEPLVAYIPIPLPVLFSCDLDPAPALSLSHCCYDCILYILYILLKNGPVNPRMKE